MKDRTYSEFWAPRDRTFCAWSSILQYSNNELKMWSERCMHLLIAVNAHRLGPISGHARLQGWLLFDWSLSLPRGSYRVVTSMKQKQIRGGGGRFGGDGPCFRWQSTPQLHGKYCLLRIKLQLIIWMQSIYKMCRETQRQTPHNWVNVYTWTSRAYCAQGTTFLTETCSCCHGSNVNEHPHNIIVLQYTFFKRHVLDKYSFIRKVIGFFGESWFFFNDFPAIGGYWYVRL